MSYTAIVGFGMMILTTTLLLKKGAGTPFAFTIILIIEALLVGASITEVCDYINVGPRKTRNLMFIVFFSPSYFSVMSEVGLFGITVESLLKHIELSIAVICIVTALVFLITEIDRSVIPICLVTVLMMLPLYKKLKIDLEALLPLYSVTICVPFVTPQNGRTLRATTLLEDIENPQNYIFLKMPPMVLIYIVLCVCLAVILARTQVKKGAGRMNEQVDTVVTMESSELRRSRLFWFNLIQTILLITDLSAVPYPDYFVSAIGLIVALCVNYPDPKLRGSLLKKYSQEMYSIACAVLLSGVMVGVSSESGVMDAMVNFLIHIASGTIGPWVYLITTLFSTPLMLIFINDIWQYALMPIVAGVSSKFDIPDEVVILTLLMDVGAMVSLVTQPQIHLACDLADDTEPVDYVKFSFMPLWILSALWVVAGYCIGIFCWRIQLCKGSTPQFHVNGK